MAKLMWKINYLSILLSWRTRYKIMDESTSLEQNTCVMPKKVIGLVHVRGKISPITWNLRPCWRLHVIGSNGVGFEKSATEPFNLVHDKSWLIALVQITFFLRLYILVDCHLLFIPSIHNKLAYPSLKLITIS